MDDLGLSFDVNCSILFTELPLSERPAVAPAAGFALGLGAREATTSP